MSKAVLVMDMPESCSKCGFYNPFGYKEWTCVLTGSIIGEQRESRHEGCPLHPMPIRDRGYGAEVMTDTEKLIADLKNHRQAYAEGVMRIEHRDITAMSTVEVLDRAIEYIEKGYLDEESKEYCLTPWGCLQAILSDYGIETKGTTGRAGEHIVSDFMDLLMETDMWRSGNEETDSKK